MWIRLSGLWLLAVLLNGCAMFGDTDNTEPPAPLPELTNTLPVKVLWSVSVGGTTKGYLKLTPAVDRNSVFVATPKGKVSAYALHDGKQLWEQSLSNMLISGGVGVGEGLVLVGGRDGQVVALSANEGNERWRVQMSSEVLTPPVISQNVVVVRTIDGKLVGLDGQTGARLWTIERTVPALSLRGTSTPSIVKDVLIAGFDNGKLAALELHTGKLLWEVTIAVPHGRSELERMVDIDADPKVAGDMVYVASFQGRTVAINILTGQLVWERDISSYAGLGTDDNALYVSDARSYLWAFDRFSGTSLWKQTKLQARDITAPISVGSYVVVGDGQGYVHWMQHADGQFVARYETGRAAISVPPLVIDNNLVVVYTSSGEMMVLGIQ